MQRPMNRRTFLARAGATVAGLVAALSGQRVNAKHPKRRVYRLNALYGPTNSDGQYCGGCHACAACLGVANHRLFVSLAAADQYRAHPGCDCQPIVGELLPYGTWVALFGNPRRIRRQYVDTRWTWVKKVLR